MRYKKKEFNDQDYKYGFFLNSLGLAYVMMNDYDTAYVHLKQALQIVLDTLGMVWIILKYVMSMPIWMIFA